MKKYLIIIPIALALSIILFKPTEASASTAQYIYDHYTTVIYLDNRPDAQYLIYSNNNSADKPFYMDNGYLTWDYPSSTVKANFSVGVFGGGYDLMSEPLGGEISGFSTSDFFCYGKQPVGIQGYYSFTSPFPPVPEAGDSWLSEMWEWFLYTLGFGDDPSIIQITGGDKVETEIVTPTPSPSPTPIPTPTPYSLNVIDPSTGQPVYTITGIPSNTYNIYGGDTTNNGSDFDIFDVDLKIGNGGTSKPKDDLNEVMRTNNDYIQEMDVSSVKDSFSVLPVDWFLMLGVLASMPIIAGIISKMLK